MTRPAIRLIFLIIGLVALEGVLLPSGPLPLGAGAAIGVVGCVGIVAVAKVLGRFWLQQREMPDA